VIFEFEDQKFDTDEIRQLYPAAMIPTGYKDELTQISLEWYDTEANGKVQAQKYGIFIHLSDKSVHSFFYKDRKELETALEKLSVTLN
jgi:hypothetical protein